MKIRRFEELECWQEARSSTKRIYAYAKGIGFSKDFRLTDQVTGASVSVMNNISEGFDAKSNNEFVRFLTYFRRSCSEVQNRLYVALDQRYMTEKQFQSSYDHCEKVRKIIDGLIRYLKNNRRPTDKPSNGPTG